MPGYRLQGVGRVDLIHVATEAIECCCHLRWRGAGFAPRLPEPRGEILAQSSPHLLCVDLGEHALLELGDRLRVLLRLFGICNDSRGCLDFSCSMNCVASDL